MEHCDKVMEEEEEVEKSQVGDMEEGEILVSWTEDLIEEEVMYKGQKLTFIYCYPLHA